MQTFSEQLDRINTAYFRSDDPALLRREADSLKALCENPLLYDDKRETAKSLLLRISAKAALLSYARTFGEEEYNAAAGNISAGIKTARERDYKKSEKVLGEFGEILKNLRAATAETLTYMDISGGHAADLEVCAKAFAAADKGLERLEGGLFSPEDPAINMGDLKERAREFIEGGKKIFSEARRGMVEKAMGACLKDITDLRRDNEYFPGEEYGEGGKAAAVILSTPILEDARLFAAFNAAPRGASGAGDRSNVNKKLFLVYAEGLSDKDGEFMSSLFDYAKRSGANCIIENCSALPEKSADELLKRAMFASKGGVRIFFTDNGGDASLYKKALDIASAAEGLSLSDISLEYISVPPFEQTKEEFERLEIAPVESAGEILKDMPFMGFCGLNALVKAHAAGDKNWRAIGRRFSSVHESAAKNYLLRLTAPYLLIDPGWGDFAAGGKREESGEFDYDAIGDVNRENIRLIVESNEQVFSKCGMAARYCTVGTDDRDVWGRLTREERQTRLLYAVRAVYQILRLPVSAALPEVEILDELENKTAGGLCYDGGKRIVFKESCTHGLDWTLDCIVHECFHSLQGKLTSGGWSEWYYNNLGISYGRVVQWIETRKIYNGNTGSDVYRVHMYEGDARAFETDCRDGCNKAWNNMEFV